MPQDSVTNTSNPQSHEMNNEVIFHIKGDSLYIIYDVRRDQLSLAVNTSWLENNSDLNHLKDKVISFTEGSVNLENGIELVYLGGYLQWAPYSVHGPNLNRKCILFSEETRFIGNKLYFWGTEQTGQFHHLYGEYKAQPYLIMQ